MQTTPDFGGIEFYSEISCMGVFTSDLSGKKFPANQKITAKALRGPVLDLIKKDNPVFSEESCLSLSELSEYRHRYMESALQQELGSLSVLEKEVLKAMQEGEVISENVDKAVDEQLTFGQRLSDRIASFGGSWTFILSFFFFLAVWIAFNIYSLSKPFDPYPFILLNLILSCIAAMQAPVIMMSQNRQEEKDRERSKHDYQVNLKAELEIRMMHEKIDHLIINQQQRLFEIQHIQIEMLQEIHDKLDLPKKNKSETTQP